MAAPAETQEALSSQLATGATDTLDADDLKALKADFNPQTDTARFAEGSGEPGAPPPPPSAIIAFTKDNLVSKSREALGIWFDKDGKVWKVYSTTNQKKAVIKALADAAKAKLPIANATLKPGQTSVVQKSPYAPWKPAFSVVTVRLKDPWKFFSAQGPVGIANFTTLIQSISDKDTLTSIKDAFVKAVAFKLTDPQGFINKGVKTDNTQFIDIHTGSTAPKAAEMLEIVKKQLEK